LVAALNRMVEAEFLRPAHREVLVVAREPAELLEAFADWEAPTVRKWLEREDA
jgi:hypothetical protein